MHIKRVLIFTTIAIIQFSTVDIQLFASRSKEHSQDFKVSADTPEEFYKSVKNISDRNWMLRTLYPMVFNPDSTEIAVGVDDPEFELWDGRIIRKIQLIGEAVFSPQDLNSKSIAYRRMAKIGSLIHANTREQVMRNNLLFKEGEALDSQILRRNLLYLRGLSYINDAQIFVLTSPTCEDSVDIAVITKDKFSLKPSMQVSSSTKYKIDLVNRNFIGFGQDLQTEWFVNIKQRGAVGWKLQYEVPNIGGSFVKGDLGWAETPGFSWKSIVFNQPFLHPVRSLAGGGGMEDSSSQAPNDTLSIRKVVLDSWMGYALLKLQVLENSFSYSAIALTKSFYPMRPPVDSNTNKYWHESLIALGSFAVSQQNFRKIPGINFMLEKENIPIGSLIEVIGGGEFGEFENRCFSGLRWSWASILGNKHYFAINAGGESFFTASDIEQGVLYLEPMCITSLTTVNKLRINGIYRGRAIQGINRLPQETLRLSSDYLFRGSVDLEGTRLYSLNIEEDISLPWEYLGTKLSLYGFVDSAWVSSNSLSTNRESRLHTGGFGLRFRNPYLVWNSIDLHIAWNQSTIVTDAMEIGIKVQAPLSLMGFDGRKPITYSFH